MGLGSRIRMIIISFIVMIPLFILLLASAIVSSIAQEGLSELKDQNSSIKNAHKYVKYCTITLWVLFALSVLGSVWTVFIASMPYIYAMIMGVFIIVNLVVAGVFFYAANAVRESKDYKEGTKESKKVFSELIGIGVAMVVASGLLFVYIIWNIHKYRKEGGLTGDIGYISEAGMVVAPEFAPVWSAGSNYSKSQLGEEAYGQRGEQVQALAGAGQGLIAAKRASGKTGLGGIVQTIKSNPELMAAAFEALA